MKSRVCHYENSSRPFLFGGLTDYLQTSVHEAASTSSRWALWLAAKSAGRAKVLVSPYKFDKPVKLTDAPPYPSEAFYDAKLWYFS